MIKKDAKGTPVQNIIVKPSGSKTNAKKMVVILSIIISGALLIAYRANQEYWAINFLTYNNILLGVSAMLLVILLIIAFLDIKMNLKREFFGSLMYAIGGLIIIVYDSRNYLGISGLGADGTAFFAAGGVIVVIGTIILMRTGGFIGVCLGGLIINIVVAGFYIFDQTTKMQYDSNTMLYLNIGIVYFIMSFLLLVYHDLKFFYLAKLMRDEHSMRSNKDFNKALIYCNKALRIYPFFVTAWNNKGNVYANMGKKNDAIKCYEKALTINPDYIPAKRNLRLMGR